MHPTPRHRPKAKNSQNPGQTHSIWPRTRLQAFWSQPQGEYACARSKALRPRARRKDKAREKAADSAPPGQPCQMKRADQHRRRFWTLAKGVQQSATPLVRFGALLRQTRQSPENTGLRNSHAVVVHVWGVVAKCLKWFPKPLIPVQFRVGVPIPFGASTCALTGVYISVLAVPGGMEVPRTASSEFRRWSRVVSSRLESSGQIPRSAPT